MRIIGGTLGGRSFDSPAGHRTHPRAERVRGAMFNSLGDLTGLRVLDAFAGSGAVGFEAVSRGADQVLAVEVDGQAVRTIKHNAGQLRLTVPAYQVVHARLQSWLRTSPAGVTYDIVLCDPPYNDTQLAAVQALTTRVAGGGLLVLSWPGRQTAPSLAGCSVERQRSYGDAQLIFYRQTAAQPE